MRSPATSKTTFFILSYLQFKLLVIPFFEKDVKVLVSPSTMYFSCVPVEYVIRKQRTGLLTDFNEAYSKDKSAAYTPVTDCSACRFPTHNYSGNSTPRDLVISLGTSYLKNVYGYVKSLRTVGCKATIMIVTDCKPPKGLLECGVTFVPIRHVPGWYNRKAVRWQVLADLLNIWDILIEFITPTSSILYSKEILLLRNLQKIKYYCQMKKVL